MDPLVRYDPRVGIFDLSVLQLKILDVDHQDQDATPVGFLIKPLFARIHTVAAAARVPSELVILVTRNSWCSRLQSIVSVRISVYGWWEKWCAK